MEKKNLVWFLLKLFNLNFYNPFFENYDKKNSSKEEFKSLKLVLKTYSLTTFFVSDPLSEVTVNK